MKIRFPNPRLLAGLALISTLGFAPPSEDETPTFPGADHFVTQIDNPFFPLVPGTTFVYEGVEGGQLSRDLFTVTHDTEPVYGVQAVVVHDLAYLDGVLVEETFDWFGQDDQGNVWYFGEDTRQLDADGNTISTEGSWRAGQQGATPGVIMLGQLELGETYRQELALGVAEDMATIISLNGNEKVPYGTFKNCLVTREFTPLERDSVEQKTYARGVGFIGSKSVRGAHEVVELVDIVHQP